MRFASGVVSGNPTVHHAGPFTRGGTMIARVEIAIDRTDDRDPSPTWGLQEEGSSGPVPCVPGFGLSAFAEEK
ncbi:autotransporter/virulence factor [Anopheles sinensis]|uniref:Autotransporter/virulence factor n=1 Tax=Anopheles sinensis TaxID=74873 RepID=A0A084VPU0_ANOSI|nr:autotransporter/virulence factor [Anopheles sinensis]